VARYGDAGGLVEAQRTTRVVRVPVRQDERGEWRRTGR